MERRTSFRGNAEQLIPIDAAAVHRELTELRQHDADLAGRVKWLQNEVNCLREAFSVFEGLATPRMAKLYQQMVGGLVAVASNDDWRMRGFYPVEESGNSHVAWTRFDQEVAIHMLLLKGESYSCALRLVRTPHIQGPDSIVVRVNGEEVRPVYDSDEDAYGFTVRAERNGWYAFSVNSRQCFEPSRGGSADRRRLGVLFRSLSLVPSVT